MDDAVIYFKWILFNKNSYLPHPKMQFLAMASSFWSLMMQAPLAQVSWLQLLMILHDTGYILTRMTQQHVYHTKSSYKYINKYFCNFLQ